LLFLNRLTAEIFQKLHSFIVWQIVSISLVSTATVRCISSTVDSELPSIKAERFHLWHFLNISAIKAI